MSEHPASNVPDQKRTRANSKLLEAANNPNVSDRVAWRVAERLRNQRRKAFDVLDTELRSKLWKKLFNRLVAEITKKCPSLNFVNYGPIMALPGIFDQFVKRLEKCGKDPYVSLAADRIWDTRTGDELHRVACYATVGEGTINLSLYVDVQGEVRDIQFYCVRYIDTSSCP